MRLILTCLGGLLAACSTPDADALRPEPWIAVAPEDAGFDGGAIMALVEELRRGDHGAVDHFILIRDGQKVVDERFQPAGYRTLIDQTGSSPRPTHDYSHASWHPYKEGTQLHSLQSATKSVTSLAVGMAIADGALPGVEVPVANYLEGVQVKDDPRWAELTLFDLLTMQSGIDWTPPEGSRGYTTEHPTLRMEGSDHWLPFVTARPMRTAPGTEFEYVDGATVLVGHILEQALGERVDAYLERRLFDPIGIEEWYWKTSPAGEADTEGGLYLSAEGLARIGVLVLDQGRWNGAQLVPAGWITESTSAHVPQIGPGTTLGYGYQWWIRRQEGGVTRTFAAFGFGGQLLLVDRGTRTVAVLLGWDDSGQTASLFPERILPAMR
jgi:CubicO group peptidase (beta-lactamase class C family)